VQGSTSPDSPQSITVLNLGNLDLAISSAVFATSTPSTGTSFTNDSTTTCTSALVANSSCVYGIDFRPAAGGTNTGSLTLTDNTLGSVGSTQTITLTGTGQALVSKLAFGQAPAANVTAGGNAGSAITILEGDSSGATVTSQTDVITLIATGPNGYQQTYMATAVAGIATFNLSGAALNTSGVYTYTASAGSPTNAVATENVSAASASAVSLSGGSTSVTAGGNAGVISATIEDAHGNSVTSYSGAVTYTLKNAAGVIIASGSSTASSGIASLNLSGTALTLANTDTLTVTAASVGSTSETIAVSPGAASKTSTLTGINTSSTYTPGSVLGPLTTTVVDAYGNTVTSYSGTITYTLTLPNGTTTTGTATVAQPRPPSRPHRSPSRPASALRSPASPTAPRLRGRSRPRPPVTAPPLPGPGPTRLRRWPPALPLRSLRPGSCLPAATSSPEPLPRPTAPPTRASPRRVRCGSPRWHPLQRSWRL